MKRSDAPGAGDQPSSGDRVALLHAKRDLKMARSAHAYVRGNTAKFYEWLEESRGAALIPDGPAIWICGDCHVGNLGPIADGAGRVAIQIRDLDQAVIGNPAHDMIRLGLSLATAARGSDLPGVITARMIEAMVEGYEAAIEDYESTDAGIEPDVVRTVRVRAIGRKWKHLAKERLEDVEPEIPLGKKFWALDQHETEALHDVFTRDDVGQMVLSLDRGGPDGGREDRVPRMVDAAYWMKGCSSLGLWRFAAIIALQGDNRRDYALVDLKEAVAPIAPIAEGAEMPADNAHRVVAAARALSPNLGQRIAATQVLDRAMFVRELMPQDLKIEAEQFTGPEALRAAHYLAFVVGKAHARQMDAPTRRDWLAQLQHGRVGGLDAPSWLWRGVVAMAARHEAGYLDHCRRYALTT
jgi:uncharacterized protein (DUF2252 family)